MSLLNDADISFLATAHNMIQPFTPNLVSEAGGRKVISYGLSSFGYDSKIANNFKLFKKDSDTACIDPMAFDYSLVDDIYVPDNDFLLMPPHSFVLAHSVERFIIPDDVFVICVGKSTYARCGLIVNVTPLEPGWQGQVTIEVSNTTDSYAKVYAGQGICQFIFFRGNRPLTTYSDRSGKYQGQSGVTLPKV